MYKCKYCGKEFETYQQLGGHVTKCTKNPNIIQNISKKQVYKIICQKCGKEFELNLTIEQYNKGQYKKYCSRSCANSRILLEETKRKISNSLIKYNTNLNNINKLKIKGKYINRICKVCNRQYNLNKNIFPEASNCFCCKECYTYYLKHKKQFLHKDTLFKLRQAGLKSASVQKIKRRSKNEIEFFNLCKQYFSNVTNNESIFNGWDADIIIHDIKYAILWNGKWHYEKICKNHSVKQVQNRDNIKISEIIKYGYIPYIIKDMGKYNKAFVNEKFNEFLISLKENNKYIYSYEIK